MNNLNSLQINTVYRVTSHKWIDKNVEYILINGIEYEEDNEMPSRVEYTEFNSKHQFAGYGMSNSYQYLTEVLEAIK